MTDTSAQRQGEHSSAVATHASHDVVRYNPDAPSEDWGWHGSWREFAPKGSTLLLAIGVVCLVLFNFTEHESHVENYYFNAIALAGALWVAARIRSGRRLRRRKHDAE